MTLRTLLYDRLSGNFIAFFVGFTILCFSTYINGDYGNFDGPWPIVIGLSLSIIWVTRLHAYREAERMRNRIKIIHKNRIKIRAAVAFAISAFIHLYVEGITWHSISLSFACAAYLSALFWFLFDPMLSNDRGLALLYVSKWYGSATLDLIYKGRWLPWLLTKVVLLAVTLFVYVKLF